MHDNVDDLIESALNTKLLSIDLNSQRLDKKKQEVKNVVKQPTERITCIEKSLQNFRLIYKSSISLKNTSQISLFHAIAPILSNKELEYSLSMGYEHPNTTPKTESDEIIKSGVKELVPIPNENEDTSEDKKECDMLVCENSPVCDNHFDILSDSNNDDYILSDDDAFEDIEYVEASLPDLEIVSLKEENVVHQEEEDVDLEDIFQIQDVVLRENLLSINRFIANIESLNDNPTPDYVLNSSVSIPIFEESDNFLSDNSSSVDDLIEIAPILSTKEPEHLLSMGYEHLSITPEMESDKVTESNVENLLPILSECDVTLEDEKPLPYPEIVSVEEENVVHQAENDEEIDLEDIS
nr:hypothetical protein [Tanacetum cinerariifolium]